MHKILFIIIFLPAGLLAQKIDHLVSYRAIESETYFRINYENDYFGATDRNYTQGYNLEFVSPYLVPNPVNYLFIKLPGNEMRYGLAVEHIGYTPKNIGSPEIQLGDRPFAAAIMLKSFLIATDALAKSRLISSFNVGILGPGAFGKEMQVGIHRATGNVIPQGWQHQIKNDVVLNYEIGFEKQLIRYRNRFALQTNSTAKIGTLFTNASVGVNAVVGIINSPFSTGMKKEKFQLYLYSQPLINTIAYDATLQGGFFNRKSPYTISSGRVKRLTAQFNYGIVLKTPGFYLEYSRTVLTREFESGHSAKWGGIKMGVAF